MTERKPVPRGELMSKVLKLVAEHQKAVIAEEQALHAQKEVARQLEDMGMEDLISSWKYDSRYPCEHEGCHKLVHHYYENKPAFCPAHTPKVEAVDAPEKKPTVAEVKAALAAEEVPF